MFKYKKIENLCQWQKKLAHPHFSICKSPKVQEAWSGLLEGIHQVSDVASNPNPPVALQLSVL